MCAPRPGFLSYDACLIRHIRRLPDFRFNLTGPQIEQTPTMRSGSFSKMRWWSLIGSGPTYTCIPICYVFGYGIVRIIPDLDGLVFPDPANQVLISDYVVVPPQVIVPYFAQSTPSRVNSTAPISPHTQQNPLAMSPTSRCEPQRRQRTMG